MKAWIDADTVQEAADRAEFPERGLLLGIVSVMWDGGFDLPSPPLTVAQFTQAFGTIAAGLIEEG
jgi:hypothetical protein